MNIARINKSSSLVENIEVWNDVPAETGDNLFVEAGSAGIGWTWDGEVFVSPPAPVFVVPGRISKLQAELYLYSFGQLAAVQAKIAEKLATGDAGYDIYWRSASHFERDHIALAAIAYEMGWTTEQLDAMFVAAATLG